MWNGINLDVDPVRPSSVLMQSQNNVHINLRWVSALCQSQKESLDHQVSAASQSHWKRIISMLTFYSPCTIGNRKDWDNTKVYGISGSYIDNIPWKTLSGVPVRVQSNVAVHSNTFRKDKAGTVKQVYSYIKMTQCYYKILGTMLHRGEIRNVVEKLSTVSRKLWDVAPNSEL